MLRRLAFILFVLILAGGGRAAYALPSASDIQGFLSSSSGGVEGHSLRKRDLVDFYKVREYKAVWNFSGAGNEAALSAFLHSAEEMVVWHGLQREDYDFDLMRKLASAQDEASRLKLEVMVMDTLLRLARSLHGDAVDLGDLYPGWTFKRAAADLPARLGEASNAQGLSGFLESLIPVHPSYLALAKSLAHYRKIAEGGGWNPIATGPTLRPGEHGPRVAQLRARLEAEEALTFPPDTALQRHSSQARQNGSSSYASAEPQIKLPTAIRSSLIVQFSQAFERLAPLDVAASDAATPQAAPTVPSSNGLSLGAGISLNPEYPGAPSVPEGSTPLRTQPGDEATQAADRVPTGHENAQASPASQPSSVPEPGQQQQTAAPVDAPARDALATPKPGNPSFFDEALREALRQWQNRNGLDGDGNAGQKTLEMLNAPVGDRINQIRANMERWRHMPEDFPPERYALVNIADAHLVLVEGGKIAYRGPVVVGRVDRKTPFIQSKIRSMIVNPFWHVPAKIARKDILPKLRRDPHYLEKLGFVISGNSDDPHGASIDWDSIPEQEFNFRLRQSPGDANSLGRIKFDFDNDFAVYMHGTPHQELFGKDRRNFSSGCIRLRDPIDVAEVVMDANQERWDERKLNDTIQSGKTRWVQVAQPLPLYVVYETVFVGFDGNLQFRKDVYNYDHFLTQTMASREM